MPGQSVHHGSGRSLPAALAQVPQSQPPSPTPPEARQIGEQLPEESDAEPGGNDESAEIRPTTLNQAKSNEDNRPHDYQASPEQNGSASKWLDPVTMFTGVLTIVAVFQVWLMWRQSGIMSDEMEATRIAAVAAKETVDQMRLDQRPCLGATAAKSGVMEVGKRLSWDVFILNSGKTPAFIYEQFNWGIHVVVPANVEQGPGLAQWLDENIESTIVTRSLDKTATIVMPGQTVFFRNSNKPEPLTAEELQGVRNGADKLYVVQLFSFTDVATNTNYDRLRFDFIFSPEHNDFVTYGSKHCMK